MEWNDILTLLIGSGWLGREIFLLLKNWQKDKQEIQNLTDDAFENYRKIAIEATETIVTKTREIVQLTEENSTLKIEVEKKSEQIFEVVEELKECTEQLEDCDCSCKES